MAVLVIGTFFIPKENDYFNPDELFSLIYKKLKKKDVISTDNSPTIKSKTELIKQNKSLENHNR